MKYDEQYLQPHGIGALPWDHASIPSRMWAKTTRKDDCWLVPEYNAKHYRETVISKMTSHNARELWAITPTCGNRLCWNPRHICITVATLASHKEK